MKTCGLCKQEKSFSEFHKNSRRADGLQSDCKSCKNARYKEHYEAGKERYRTNAKANNTRVVEYLREAKNVPCRDCGVKYPYYIMQFDHLEGKVGHVSDMKGTMKKAIAEIAKCEVVCANCHAARTWQRMQHL